MKKTVIIFTIAAIFALALPVFAGDNNGQKIGQDEFRLALTKCSNAGIGNGGEFETGLLKYSLSSDCLEKCFLKKYSRAEMEAILAQSSCINLGPLWVCEIDPGNSAAHNANNE